MIIFGDCIGDQCEKNPWIGLEFVFFIPKPKIYTEMLKLLHKKTETRFLLQKTLLNYYIKRQKPVFCCKNPFSTIQII